MQIRAPQASVTLYKLRPRQQLGGQYHASSRFAGMQQVDLTQHLSDNGLRVTRAISDPNGGTFQIAFDNKPITSPKAFGDSVYGLVEPGDVIEIRAAGMKSSAKLPLIMRGFVKNVAEPSRMEGDGPSRLVIVSGFDITHVLQLLRVRYSALGTDVLDAKALREEFGIPFGSPSLDPFQALIEFSGPDVNSMDPAQFVQNAVDQLVTPYLQKLFGAVSALSSLLTITSKCDIVDGIVPPMQGVSAFDGRSVYEVLAQVLDVGPFNELFVDDQDDGGLVLVSRPLPYVDASGKQLGGSKPAATLQITDGDVIEHSLSRDDTGVANYFWVQRAADLVNDGLRRLAGAGGPQSTYLLTGENTNPTAFGWRFMEVQTALLASRAAVVAPSDATNLDRSDNEEAWLTQRRKLLMDLNRDNVVFESGSLQLKGNEAVKPGTYLLWTRGSAGAAVRLYVDAVSHSFGQGNGFTTTVSVSRGTGWLERAAADGLPYYVIRSEKGVS